jgi:hypothetical protein
MPSSSPAAPAVSRSERLPCAFADHADPARSHAEVGPMVEDVDRSVPAEWTHLRRRRRRVSAIVCEPTQPRFFASVQPPATSSPPRSSSPPVTARSSSPGVRHPSPQPTFPSSWPSSHRTFLSAVMQPTGGQPDLRPAGPAPPGPAAAGAASRGGETGAAPRLPVARPSPPFSQPPGGAAVGLHLQQNVTPGSAAHGLHLQQNVAPGSAAQGPLVQQQGHGQLVYAPPLP